MEEPNEGWSIEELAELLQGKVGRTGDQRILRPVPAGFTDPNGVTFAENPKYLALAESSQIGVILVGEGLAPSRSPYIIVTNAKQAFGVILHISRKEPVLENGVSALASVHSSAQIDSTAAIGPYCYVGQDAFIGPNVRIHPFCYVGDRSHIDAESVLYPHVVVMHDCRVGSNAILHSGSVIGADGFGFAWDGTNHLRIPQVGGVELFPKVEVGANSCIDKSTCGETIIRGGTKIDNLVQIAHNCEIGEHTLIASQTGMAGSVKIGSHVVMGGQVAIRDHVEIGDKVQLAGRTGITTDVLEPGAYFGTPATPVRDGMKVMLLTQRLPDLYDRIKKLEAEVAQLKNES